MCFKQIMTFISIQLTLNGTQSIQVWVLTMTISAQTLIENYTFDNITSCYGENKINIHSVNYC